MTELNYLDITKANDGHIRVSSIGLTSPAITESIAKTALASFADGAEGIPVKSLIADINPVQTRSGDPSPSNVRPITGWTGMNVYQSIFCKRFIPTSYSAGDVIETKNGVTVEYLGDGKYHLFGTNTSSSTTNFTPVAITSFTTQTQDDEHRIFAFNNNATGSANINFRSNGTWLSNATFNAVNREFTYTSTLTGQEITDFFFSVSANATVDIICTPTFYDKNNTPLPISWADEAGTVYGGTLDVTTGLLTVTHGIVEYDGSADESWTKGGGANECYIRNDAVKRFADYRGQMFCDKLATYKHNDNLVAQYGISGYVDNETYLSQNWLYVHLTNTTLTVADLKTWLQSNPITVCYPLATPQTYQLTPQAVLTILGQNNIWADTGDVEVAYVADTKLYIDKVLTE